MTRIADMAAAIAPPWLRGPVGSRLLYALTVPLDALADWAFQGVKARFPFEAPPSALGALGHDRRVRRGPAETDEAYAVRLARFLEDHRTEGNAWALLDQLAGYFSPTPPLMRFVQSNGTSAVWYTRQPDGARSRFVATPTNFDWDGAGASKRSRGFVIIYLDATGNPYADGGTWGDGVRAWGDGGTWGTSAMPADVSGVLGLLEDWRAAHALFTWLILAFDPDSFDPTAVAGSLGLPDGTWGRWHKIVGGAAVAARLTTARYWEIG